MEDALVAVSSRRVGARVVGLTLEGVCRERQSRPSAEAPTTAAVAPAYFRKRRRSKNHLTLTIYWVNWGLLSTVQKDLALERGHDK